MSAALRRPRIAEPLWDRATDEALKRVIRQRGKVHPAWSVVP
ncbi:hypothetical protein [Streptomyces katsurahamanus]|nr:hypothetical protein [Streptomyces katsurahamanus]